MSFKSMVFIRQGFVACVMLASLQLCYAETITNFESALAKVHQYQAQNEIWQQSQNISDLNLKNSRLWQNPSFNLEQSGFSSNQDQEFTISINQPLDVFGERKLNQKIAEVSDEQLKVLQSLWNVQSQLIVKYKWSQLALANVEQSLYASQFKVSQANVESAQKRYQAGSIALVDFERAKIEALEIQQLHQQAILNRQIAQNELSNLWGEATSLIQPDVSSIFWPDDTTQTVEDNIDEGWLEKFYALNIQQSNHQIERLKLKTRPSPTINVAMSRTKSTNDQNNSTFGIGIDVPLNIFNRQQYSIPIAQQQQLLINQQQQSELKHQILEITNNIQQLDALRRQFDASTKQIDLSINVHSRTLQGFQAGKFSISDVQQSTAQLQDLRLGQLKILRQAWQTALAAEALSIGLSFEEISQSDAYRQLNKNILEISQNLINDGAR